MTARDLGEQIQRNMVRIKFNRVKRMLAKRMFNGAWSILENILSESKVLSERLQMEVKASAILGALYLQKRTMASRMLRQTKKDLSQVLAPPYNKIGKEFFLAYADYLSPTLAKKQHAVRTMSKLGARLSPTEKKQYLNFVGNIQCQMGHLYFSGGQMRKAQRALEQATRLFAAKNILAYHNLAVVNYQIKKKNGFVDVMQQAATKVPIAYCNLAIHYDQTGSKKKSYDLFRQCQLKHVRFPNLKSIIEIRKEIFTALNKI